MSQHYKCLDNMLFGCCAFAVLYIFCMQCCNSEPIYSCATTSHPMTLQCQNNEIVTGFLSSGSRIDGNNCTYQDDDCMYSEHLGIKNCLWKKNHCTFTIGKIGSAAMCLWKGTIKYIMVEHFECMPAKDIHQMCITPTKELFAPADNTTNNSRYITSQGFLDGYSHYKGSDLNQSLCSVTIITEPGYGIKLWSNYMNIYKDDHISIEGRESNFRRTFTNDDNVEVYVPDNNVEFSFIIDYQKGDNGKVGFALRYESFLLNITNITIPSEPTSTVVVNTTMYDTSAQPYSDSTKKHIPTETGNLQTWIPIVIATALVVLVVLLTSVFVMVCRYYRTKQSRSAVTGSENGICPNFDDKSFNGSGSVRFFENGVVNHKGKDFDAETTYRGSM